MTDVPQPPEGTGSAQPQEELFIVPFHAEIRVVSPMQVSDGGVELLIEDRRVVVPVMDSLSQKLQEQPPEPNGLYRVSLWFRVVEGQIQELMCFDCVLLKHRTLNSTMSRTPQFAAGVSLKAMHLDKGFVVVEVKPNVKGGLQEPFDLQIWLSPDLLQQYLQLGQTYRILGRYDSLNERLIATNIKSMKIGEPMLPRVVKPVKQKTPPHELRKIQKQKDRRWRKEQAKALALAEEVKSVVESENMVTAPES